MKVLEKGWKVKKIIRGQTKHGLWGSNVKTRKYLPQELSRIKFVALFSEPHFPVAPGLTFLRMYDGSPTIIFILQVFIQLFFIPLVFIPL